MADKRDSISSEEQQTDLQQVLSKLNRIEQRLAKIERTSHKGFYYNFGFASVAIGVGVVASSASWKGLFPGFIGTVIFLAGLALMCSASKTGSRKGTTK
jgi:predicted membrane protein